MSQIEYAVTAIFRKKKMTEKPKRNYIRRKKCLSNSVACIKSTFDRIKAILGNSFPNIDIEKISIDYGRGIEAACWFPHCKMSDVDYQKLVNMKTAKLCQTLFKQFLPFQQITPNLKPKRQRHELPECPRTPVPITSSSLPQMPFEAPIFPQIQEKMEPNSISTEIVHHSKSEDSDSIYTENVGNLFTFLSDDLFG